MNTWIIMLRGINVSGQKLIKMEDLRELFTRLNFRDVQTYIQSGNAVFRNDAKDAGAIEDEVEDAIQKRFGFDVTVIVRTGGEFERILKNNPYDDRDINRLYVTFFKDFPAGERISNIDPKAYPEEFVFDGTHVYFYAPNGLGRAKLNNNHLEAKLKLRATTRNWKTVNKLFQMTR